MSNEINAEKIEILNGYLETISGISDRQYQERVWIRGEGPEFDDYTESICHFFDDGDPIISNYKDYGITESQLVIVNELRKYIDEFNSNIRFELGSDFYNSQEWIKITLIAKEVLRAFGYLEANNTKSQ